jgi:hypothetical protein
MKNKLHARTPYPVLILLLLLLLLPKRQNRLRFMETQWDTGNRSNRSNRIHVGILHCRLNFLDSWRTLWIW